MSAINTPSYVSAGEIRASAILTGSYVVAKTFGLNDTTGSRQDEQRRNVESTHLLLDFTFTKGSLTYCFIKVEYSDDGATWFQQTSEATSAGVSTLSSQEYKLTGTGTGTVAVPLIKHIWMRVSAIGVGTVTSSSLAMQARFIS